MDKSFYIENRQELYKTLSKKTVVISFAGVAPHRTADVNYIFFTNRNFFYLTGLEGTETEKFIFMAEKTENNEIIETIFFLPPNLMLERWNGRRLKPDEIAEKSGIDNIQNVDDFKTMLHKILYLGKYNTLALDLHKNTFNQANTMAHDFAEHFSKQYPDIKIDNIYRQLRKQRTIKKPCEIKAMEKAETITKAGIVAMMKNSVPGMYEYEYKALFDKELTSKGVLEPAFNSIISTGDNNFCIHYYGYRGKSKDGDMILNDVGAIWDGMCTDVSRGWPCNGKFNERQKLLYKAAYDTSEYLFSIIKPGMIMADVDKLSHSFCAKELVKIGLLDDENNVSKYMWHGGAHHVGFDVHDEVEVNETMQAGMVFCVDIGIYVEEWGIGFRLEDNCLVTETGSKNLSADIPRSIEDIEKTMIK
ncbi:MAG: Xaa-Pro aminopeptidase [Clostridia bacterium]